MPIIIWIGKSLLILGIFHMVVPTVVNGQTRNSWAKFPVMLLCAFVAGAFMAWLGYVPYLLFFVWLSLTFYTLQAMTERKFETEAGMRMSKPVFYISSYSYVIVACLLAWFLQIEIVSGSDPSGPGTPLWRQYLVSSRSSVGVTHVPWFYFAWTFVVAVITGFALFSRGAVFRRPTGQVIQSILSLLCFGFIGWAFWRLGWKTGLAEVAVIFIGASFGRSLLSYLFRR